MLTYKDSGVDITEGYRAVSSYKESARRTAIPGILSDLGSFNGIFQVPSGMKDPVMVSGTDGVGTKLDVAFKMRKYDTVGIDCVAMSVNDILCSGVRSLFFLDYIACGKLDASVAGELVKGVSEGCIQAGCALLGGETAEMPGFYDEGKYDLAGFAVGVAERSKLITGRDVQAGDVLIGLSSSGVHSNGFSLVRKLVKDYTEPFSEEGHETGKTIGDVLLTPTRIYVQPVMEVLERFKGSVHAMAHITGGGFRENIPRMYKKGEHGEANFLSVLKKGSWSIPKIFLKLIELGADKKTLFDTFNMGLGFILSVESGKAHEILKMFNDNSSKYTFGYTEPLKAFEVGYVASVNDRESLSRDENLLVI